MKVYLPTPHPPCYDAYLGAKMKVYPPPPIVRIQPDVAVVRFACKTFMLSTSRVFCLFVFLLRFLLFCGAVFAGFVVVVVVSFCLVCLFSVVC